MSNVAIVAIAIWLLLFGILGLVSTEIPKWIIPLAALIIGCVVLALGGWWKKGP